MTSFFFLFFFFNDTATTEIYTLSLHDALPISNDDGMAMLDEVLEDLLQVHFLRRPVDQSEHDRAEGRLHLRMLVELVQHDGRHGIALQVDDDAHPLAVRIILDVRDPVEDRKSVV